MQTKLDPLIGSFRIVGLHGYKNVGIRFAGPTRIVIADNGAGKTTILSTLQYFLEGELLRLNRLSFERIECVLWNGTELVLNKAQLASASPSVNTPDLFEISRYTRHPPEAVRRILLEDTAAAGDVGDKSALLEEIFANSPWSYDEVESLAERVQKELQLSTPEEVRELATQIRVAAKNHHLLYLPTYRRVESRAADRSRAAMSNRQAFYRRARNPAPRMRPGQVTGLIQFGLEDVEMRLTELFEEIQKASNLGYRTISASIIDDLLMRGVLSDRDDASELPSVEALNRLFARVSQGPTEQRMASLSDIYKTDIESQKFDSLRYFLKKLSRVIDRTRELESRIEKFVGKVNTYLAASSDEKEFQYDAAGMKVLVKNLTTKGEVAFDDLSSGEKQVISMLAYMYLYDESRFVLIDEPELSLSIEWQRRLLPDLVESPTCSQLLAITHSPFVFENELDPYAGPLEVERSKGSKP